MKTIIKLFTLTVCVIFLFSFCKPQEEKSEIHEGVIPYPYTDIVKSITDSYFQIGDSIYTFNQIEGCYYYSPFHKINLFYVNLIDSLKNTHSFVSLLVLEIYTGEVGPSIFFQKGIRKIDKLDIHNVQLSVLDLSHSMYYSAIQSAFTWDTVFYENREFKGKGSFEIMETLYTDNPDIYYPPQKIEFEFK